MLEEPITHRMMVLALQLGIILFAARLANMLFEKLKLPGVIGEIVAGILLGPYLLGGMSLPGFPHGLFPVAGAFPIHPELYGFCSVASIVLLFLVGLETDTRLFLRYSLVGGLVGLGGVVFSFAFGALTAMALSSWISGAPLTFLSPTTLFLGVMSTATSVGITARVLSEKRKLDSPEGVTILAGAVVDDVLGIICLAVAMGVISASAGSGSIHWGRIGIIAAKAVGIWLAATALGLLASNRISTLLKWFRDRSSIGIMALGLALVLAGLFEEAGLAMIIGAYVMGLSLSSTDISHVVRERLQPVSGFLVPVFFVVMGMLVDVRLLASRQILLFGAVYTLGAAVAKILGCGVPPLFFNFNARGALRVGLGMLPRGEVALIIAGIGLAAGLVSPQIFGVGVLMTLVTTLLAPPALVAAMRAGRPGLRRETETPRGESLTFHFPAADMAEIMAAKLLDVFESEGFFTHTLNRDERLYQLRKDGSVIGLRQAEGDLVFDCAAADVPLVNTAVYEVLADLERIVAELRKPMNLRAMAARMQETAENAGRRVDLSSVLTPRVMEPRLAADTKEGVIDELLTILWRTGNLTDIGPAREAVLAREQSMSTGMQYGIALPHARTDAVGGIVLAVGLKPQGMDFDSLDGNPSTIFVLMLSCASAATPHVEYLSAVSQVLDETGRRDLLACDTPEAMCEVLRRRAAEKFPAAAGGAGMLRRMSARTAT